MSKLIILGRSPFINKIDFKKIEEKKYDVCVINHAHSECKKYQYFVSADEQTLCPNFKAEWISRNTGWGFIYHQRGRNVILEENKISWRHFSSSVAVSFAILRGYEEIYLAGIDLCGGEPFEHFDGTYTKNILSQEICEEERQFIVGMCLLNDVKLYTLDPLNKWLIHKDIGVLK